MLMTLVGECFMVTAAAHELTSLTALHLNACSTLGGALKAAIPALPFTIADEPAPCQSRSTPPPQYPKSEPASMCGCSYGGLCLVRIPYTCGLSTIQLTGFTRRSNRIRNSHGKTDGVGTSVGVGGASWAYPSHHSAARNHRPHHTDGHHTRRRPAAHGGGTVDALCCGVEGTCSPPLPVNCWVSGWERASSSVSPTCEDGRAGYRDTGTAGSR
jgi:hypothetical protein